MAPLVQPDWDMFHSQHPASLLHASARVVRCAFARCVMHWLHCQSNPGRTFGLPLHVQLAAELRWQSFGQQDHCPSFLRILSHAHRKNPFWRLVVVCRSAAAPST
jgi:hypothetical protein